MVDGCRKDGGRNKRALERRQNLVTLMRARLEEMVGKI